MSVSGMSALSWVDVAMLGVLALSVLLGLLRGLTFEVMALLGWVAAYFAAQAYAADVAVHLPVGAPGSALNYAAGFAATFVAVLLGWSLLSRLVRLAVRATPLTAPDRLLGGVFGLMRGLVLLLVLATLVAFTPAVRSPAWAGSQGASWLGELLQALKPMLPDDVARHLPA